MYLPNLRTPSTTSRIRQQTQGQAYFPHSTLSFLFAVACNCRILGHHRQRQCFASKLKGGHISLSPACPSLSFIFVVPESSDTIDNVKDSPANTRAGVFPSLHLVLRRHGGM